MKTTLFIDMYVLVMIVIKFSCAIAFVADKMTDCNDSLALCAYENNYFSNCKVQYAKKIVK
jgi:hypothetical protein